MILSLHGFLHESLIDEFAVFVLREQQVFELRRSRRGCEADAVGGNVAQVLEQIRDRAYGRIEERIIRSLSPTVEGNAIIGLVVAECGMDHYRTPRIDARIDEGRGPRAIDGPSDSKDENRYVACRLLGRIGPWSCAKPSPPSSCYRSPIDIPALDED